MGYEVGPDGFIRRTGGERPTYSVRPVPTPAPPSRNQSSSGVMIGLVVLVAIILAVIGITNSGTGSSQSNVPVAQPTPVVSVPADNPSLVASGFVASIGARVQELNFFAGGGVAPAKENRTYGATFRPESGQFVYWELNLQHPTRTTRQDFSIVTYLYAPDGSLMTQNQNSSYVDPGWANSCHSNRWGPIDAWVSGEYRTSLFVDGIKVAAGTFSIEPTVATQPAEAAANQSIAAARQLYEQREYKDAVAACDAALRSSPGSTEASELRAQILRTMEILGIQ